jgi:hypothetical protein
MPAEGPIGDGRRFDVAEGLGSANTGRSAIERLAGDLPFATRAMLLAGVN